MDADGSCIVLVCRPTSYCPFILAKHLSIFNQNTNFYSLTKKESSELGLKCVKIKLIQKFKVKKKIF